MSTEVALEFIKLKAINGHYEVDSIEEKIVLVKAFKQVFEDNYETYERLIRVKGV